jgi:hypothetical protein
MEEAQFSFNVKCRLGGYSSQLTVRAGEGQTLGAFRETITAAVSMLRSLGGEPEPGWGVVKPGNGNGGKEKPEAATTRRVCPVCSQDDRLELIHFSRNGQELSKYKCKRCDKWLPAALQPSKEELSALVSQDINTLWS